MKFKSKVRENYIKKSILVLSLPANNFTENQLPQELPKDLHGPFKRSSFKWTNSVILCA